MWIKQGRIFNLGPCAVRSTHAQVPTPYVMADRVRVYYACRLHGKSFPAFFDLDFDLKTIIRAHEEPIMDHGKLGMFDADGVMPSCVIKNGDELWMYYIGWSELKNTARYQNEIGVAVSKDGGETFERMFSGPIMGRSSTEPGLAVMPFILKDGDKYKMWYQSGTGWHGIDDKYEPTYVIKYAESNDGIIWDRSSVECFELEHREAVSRPSIVVEGNEFIMWYCRRHSRQYRGGLGSYRIGYAESYGSPENFVRFDYKCGLSLGEEDEWDSSMQCYPYVIDINDKRVMFYNGNDFGQTGIGLAIWE